MDLLQGLNSVQAQAVQAVEGPVLVLAGPGSGKTRVLTHRIAYLIREHGVPPYHILAVTFTNKAAKEMTARLRQLIGSDASSLTIGTFHSVCVRILRREAEHLGISSSFVIYDEDDQERLITQILKDLNVDSKQYRPSAVLNTISRAKNEMETADTYRPPTYWHEAVARVFERYDRAKAENNALDFDDLLLKAVELFRDHDDVRERYQRRYRYMLVDEFQDTNKAQYDLILHLASYDPNVFVVGDEDQSIYSWRGADFRNVMRFRADFPKAQTFLLEQNYRSTGTILQAAQSIIAHNVHRVKKELWTQRDKGPLIRLFEAYEEREEAEYVVNEIQRLVARGRCELGDCAVMYRTNAQSRAVEEAFIRHGLPYKLVGGTRFYHRREIKDILSYLRVVQNPDDEVGLTRIINVPRRGIGNKTVEELQEWARDMGFTMGSGLQYLAELHKEKGSLSETPFSARTAKLLLDMGQLLAELIGAKSRLTLSELLKLLLERIDYVTYLRDGTEEGEERVSNVQELFSVTDQYNNMPPEAALSSFLEEVALVADVDELDANADAVTMLTLHTAKGLEYGSVFIVGLEEGICPHSRSLDDPDALEEERRLCYVGVTRAKTNLYLLHTFRRTLYGSSEVREPSRFLMDIPPQLMEGTIVRSSLARPQTPSRNSRFGSGSKRRNRW